MCVTLSVSPSAPPVADCEKLTSALLLVTPPLSPFLVGFCQYRSPTELNCPEKRVKVSYTSTVVCGYSSLPIYALSCSYFRRRRYLFRSDLFKKHMARNLSLAFFLSASVTTSPLLNSTCSVLYRNSLPLTSSRICTFDLKRFRSEFFYSVSPCLIVKKYISDLCSMRLVPA